MPLLVAIEVRVRGDGVVLVPDLGDPAPATDQNSQRCGQADLPPLAEPSSTDHDGRVVPKRDFDVADRPQLDHRMRSSSA